MKPSKFEKLSTDYKLENIFKIYNQKEMVTKLHSLRQNIKIAKIKPSHIQSVDNGKLNYNTSIHNKNSRANRLLVEMPEVDAHLEATPNSSNRVINGKEWDQNTNSRQNISISSFNGAIKEQ